MKLTLTNCLLMTFGVLAAAAGLVYFALGDYMPAIFSEVFALVLIQTARTD